MAFRNVIFSSVGIWVPIVESSPFPLFLNDYFKNLVSIRLISCMYNFQYFYDMRTLMYWILQVLRIFTYEVHLLLSPELCDPSYLTKNAVYVHHKNHSVIVLGKLSACILWIIWKFSMFCWPCISIWSCKEKPTWCTSYS